MECGIADRVEIKVFNIAAEMIHSTILTDSPLVINSKYAYEYEWNVDGIASGIYVYLIKARKEGEGEIKVIKKEAIIK